MGAAIIEFLGSAVSGSFAEEILAGLVVGAVLSASALLARLWRERKVLYFEEAYNSKIGFLPPFDGHATRDSILTNFNNVSVVVLRVWNGGRANIDATDFTRPLEFVAEDRFIVDFRVSKPEPPEVATAKRVEETWRVSSAEVGLGAPETQLLSQSELRNTLPESLYSEREGGFDEREREQRRKLMIPAMSLRRGHSFSVVVCLREDKDLREAQPSTKGYTFGGDLLPGRIVQKGVRRRRRPTVTHVAATVLVLCLAGVLVWSLGPRPAEFCADGDLQAVGSSAFSGTVRYAADSYLQECGRSRIAVDMTSSIDGVRRLPQATGQMIAFSDGVAAEGEGYERDPVAVLTFNVVVNTTVSVRDLSQDEIRGINDGVITNWSQLRGPDLPIRIVGRNADSGSRQAFERYVLQGGEAPLTSNSCVEQDRGFRAEVTRCERRTTQEVLQAVDDTPGAIGYSDASAVGGYAGVRAVTIGGLQSTPDNLERGYEFWTVEYAYRRDQQPGSLSENFLRYLQRDAVARRMREEGYVPCQRSDGSIESLCQTNR